MMLFSMRLLQEQAIRNKQPMLAAFVYLSKAYDSVDRELVWQCFRHRGMPEKLLNMLQLLHSRTECAVKGDNVLTSSWSEVCTGFKQGDVNASMLFNLFLDTVLREMQPELVRTGLAYFYRVDGVLREMPSRNLPDTFWSILFADDMSLVAPSTEQMQIALETADTVFSKWGLEMSFKKTKVMALGCDVVPSHFHLERGSIETVSCFKYLGSCLAKDGGIGLEVTHRIKAAAYAFHKLKAFWKDAHVKEAVKLKVYQAIVQATLLYACETLAISLETVSSLEVFQMQCLRRIFRISKMEHVSNAQILARAKLETVHDLIRYSRLRWLGHLTRQENTRLPKRILHSRLPSNASRGRPPKCWTDYVREDLEALRLLLNWSRLAKDRESWRDKIHQILGHTQQIAGNVSLIH